MGVEDEKKRKRVNGGGQREVRGLHIACLFVFVCFIVFFDAMTNGWAYIHQNIYKMCN